jgi:hypothetical protein
MHDVTASGQAYEFETGVSRQKTVLQTQESSKETALRGLRVLTVGHSFHVYIAQFLPDIARSAGIRGHVAVGTHFLGGSRVVEHWHRPDPYNGAKRALRAGGVDVLTLSPIFHPDEGIDHFTRLALEHNPSIRVTVQVSWVPFDGVIAANHYPSGTGRDSWTAADLRELHEPYFLSVDKEVESLNRGYGRPILSVVPVGQALLRLRERVHRREAAGLNSQNELFVDPLGHPAIPVQVLAAYTHFAVLYRRSPVGLPAPAVLGRGRKVELNHLLQELAWQAAVAHRLSGLAGPPHTP